MSASYDLYQEQILDHYKHPRNKGPLPGATLNARDSNPLCGDEVILHLNIHGSRNASYVRLEGQRCAMSQASASILTTMAEWSSMAQVGTRDPDSTRSTLRFP